MKVKAIIFLSALIVLILVINLQKDYGMNFV